MTPLLLALPSPEAAAAAAAAAAGIVGDPTGALNQVAPNFLHALWSATWQGGLAILLALAATRLLRKRMTPAVAAGLWWLASAKLVLGLALAAAPVDLPILPPALAAAIGHAPTAIASETITPLTAVIQTGSLGGKKASPIPSLAPSRPTASNGHKGGSTASASPNGASPAIPTVEPQRVREIPTLATMLVVLWGAGVLCHAGLALRQYRLARGLVMRAHALTGEDEASRDLLRETAGLASRMGLKAAPQLMASNEIASPLLVGLGLAGSAPVVLLPTSALASFGAAAGTSAEVATAATLTATEMRLVLAHELAHVRRLDPVLGLIPALALSLFFFHPLVWLACREWDIAREAACDAAALEATGARPDRYGSLLVKLGALATAALSGASRLAYRGETAAPTPGGSAALGAASSGYAALRRRLVFLQQALRSGATDSPASSANPQRRRAARATLLSVVALAGLVPWRPVAAPAEAPAVVPAPVLGEESEEARPTSEPAEPSDAHPVITRTVSRLQQSATSATTAATVTAAAASRHRSTPTSVTTVRRSRTVTTGVETVASRTRPRQVQKHLPSAVVPTIASTEPFQTRFSDLAVQALATVEFRESKVENATADVVTSVFVEGLAFQGEQPAAEMTVATTDVVVRMPATLGGGETTAVVLTPRSATLAVTGAIAHDSTPRGRMEQGVKARVRPSLSIRVVTTASAETPATPTPVPGPVGNPVGITAALAARALTGPAPAPAPASPAPRPTVGTDSPVPPPASPSVVTTEEEGGSGPLPPVVPTEAVVPAGTPGAAPATNPSPGMGNNRMTSPLMRPV